MCVSVFVEGCACVCVCVCVCVCLEVCLCVCVGGLMESGFPVQMSFSVSAYVLGAVVLSSTSGKLRA